MNIEIEQRTMFEADYLLKHNGTVRSLAKIFKVSKSTIHYDLALRLKHIDYEMYKKVNSILKFNLKERHIRGGESTKKKYALMRKNK